MKNIESNSLGEKSIMNSDVTFDEVLMFEEFFFQTNENIICRFWFDLWKIYNLNEECDFDVWLLKTKSNNKCIDFEIWNVYFEIEKNDKHF